MGIVELGEFASDHFNYWVAVGGGPSHKMGTGCLLRRKMTKLRNSYPEDIARVL